MKKIICLLLILLITVLVWAIIENSYRKRLESTTHSLYVSLDKISKEKQFLQDKVATLEEEIAQLKQEKGKLKKENISKDKKIAELENKIKNLRNEIKTLKENLKQLEEKSEAFPP